MISSAVAYTLIAASANVVGAAAVTARSRLSMSVLDKLIAFSAGFLISVALAELVPEAIAEHGASGGVIILAGYVLVHFTQHTLAPHFHFGEETHQVTRAVSVAALIGLLLHTFIDGVAIASGFQVSQSLGLLVFVAILLHKFPEGLAISSMFLASGASRGRALAAGTALAIATILGGLMTQYFAPLRTYGLPLAAGVALYVGASNLVPEFQGKKGWDLPVSFFAGCGLFVLARKLMNG